MSVAIIANVRLSILSVLIFWAGASEGAVVHVPIKSNLVLKPGQAYTITADAIEPMEIGWHLGNQSRDAPSDCVLHVSPFTKTPQRRPTGRPIKLTITKVAMSGVTTASHRAL